MPDNAYRQDLVSVYREGRDELATRRGTSCQLFEGHLAGLDLDRGPEFVHHWSKNISLYDSRNDHCISQYIELALISHS